MQEGDVLTGAKQVYWMKQQDSTEGRESIRFICGRENIHLRFGRWQSQQEKAF
jgi:hypothetical protein